MSERVKRTWEFDIGTDYTPISKRVVWEREFGGHLVTSATRGLSLTETMCFHSTDDGGILNFDELSSVSGDDHEAAVRAVGFEVVESFEAVA